MDPLVKDRMDGMSAYKIEFARLGEDDKTSESEGSCDLNRALMHSTIARTRTIRVEDIV